MVVRRDKRKIPTSQGRIQPNMLGSVDTVIGQFILVVMDGDEGTYEPGPNIVLMASKPGRRHWGFNLSRLTRDELDGLAQLVEIAREFAGPIVDYRDKVAKNAFDQGDDSFIRLYRAVPRVVIRERALAKYRDLLQRGSEYFTSPLWKSGDSASGTGANGEAVANGDPSGESPEDNGEKADDT